MNLRWLYDLSKNEKATGDMVPRYDAAVIAPVNADAPILLASMKVYPMNSFELKGNELTWVKKKVAKTPVVKTAA